MQPREVYRQIMPGAECEQLMKLRDVICLCTFFSWLSIPNADASLNLSSATEACDFLSSVGLSTQGWKSLGDNEYGCNSSYKVLGNESLPNNIAYYVDGTSLGKVSKVYLVLNINARPSAPAGSRELLRDGSLLIAKTTGSTVPTAIVNAILNGKPAKVRIKQSSVEVTRQDWPTGRGYEIHVAVSE